MRSSKSKYTNYKRPPRTGALVTIGRVEDVPENCGATVELEAGGELALYNVGGAFYAIENFCPHKGAPLADGKLTGCIVECDWHGWRFDARTGQCLTRRGADVESYEVVIEDGWIKIRI